MTPPSSTAMQLGHPLVATPALCGFAWAVIRACYDPSLWPVVIILLCVIGPIANAKRKRDQYRAWMRQWDAMAEPQEPSRRIPSSKVKRWIGVAMLMLLGLCFATHASDPLYAGALVWLVLAVGIAALVAVVRNRLKHWPAARAKDAPVAICIRQPLMPVPRMRDAYRALPSHCRILLGL